MRYTFFALLFLTFGTHPCYSQSPKVLKIEQYTSSKSAEARAYYNKGSDYFDNGNYAKAIENYRLAITIDNNYIDAYDNLGLTFRKAGDLDSAKYYYLTSIKKYPKGAAALRNLATIEMMNQNFGPAKDYYDQAIAIDAKDAEAYFGLTRLYSLTQNLPQAIKSGLKAEQIYQETNDPNIGDCYLLLAVIYTMSQDKPNAQRYLAKAQNTGMTIQQNYVDMINR